MGFKHWRLIRLTFGRHPTHFGEVGIGLEQTSERVRSDTLFSAWMSAYAKLFGKEAVETLLAGFDAPQPPFRLSSTFVYRRQGKRFVDYLPKPFSQPLNYPNDDLDFAKAFRKLNYLPLFLWQRWYRGQGFSSEDAKELTEYANKPDPASAPTLWQAGCFSYGNAFKSYELPKVSIDRTTHATNFYHTGYVQFDWQESNDDSSNWGELGVDSLAGLYFLLEVPEGSPQQNVEAKLQQALTLLGEEGLGGERSSGAGRFMVAQWSKLPPHWQQAMASKNPDDRHMLLSLFYQETLQADWLGDAARYAVQERGGWIASPFSGRQLRRKMVRMFSEGSVFPQKPEGHLVDVTPPQFTRHKIYRNGIAVSLPIASAAQ